MYCRLMSSGSVLTTPHSTWIGDTAVTAYVQLYHDDNSSYRYGELLTRVVDGPGIETFLEQLPPDGHRDLLEWQLMLKEEFTALTGHRLSINIHNKLIDDERRRQSFVELLARFPTVCTIEFTETHPMPPVLDANRLLRSVRELGFETALDDFGTGLNGMSLLTDYDFSIIKVDRSLIFDIDTRVEKRKTVALIRKMLAVLSKKHVVEGVETTDLHQRLRRLGFSVFQGYGFHRPTPIGDVIEQLSTVEEAS